MKKLIPVIMLLASAFTLPAAEPVWTVRTGINLTPGLVYNRTWEPGYNGSAAAVMLLRQSARRILGAGIEAGYNYTGFNLLFPLRAGMVLGEGELFSFSANLDLMPGLILGRPSPYLLLAAEMSAEAAWKVSSRFALSLSAGPRYTVSPAYSEAVSPLELVDLTIGITAVVRK